METSVELSVRTIHKLPEELWLKILRLACGIADFDHAPKLMSFPVALVTKKNLRKRMIFQRRIISVCKVWYRIALPCLYEEIAIMDVSGLPKIAKILPENPLGRYTKRLDYFVNGLVDNDAFLDVLGCLTNLRIVRIDSPNFRLPTSVWNRILALPNLRVLHAPYRLSLSGHTFTPRSSTLQAMTYPLFDRQPDIAVDQHSHSALLNLSQLYFPYRFNYDFNTYSRRALQSVTSIIIGYRYDDPYAQLLNGVCPLLPSLKYIGIQANTFHSCLYRWTIDGYSLDIPSSVHTLGLTFQQPNARTHTYRALCQSLRQLHGGGLKVIRLGAQTVLDLRSRPAAAALVEDTLRAKGWRLEVGDMRI
ncbi:hypothetical protein C8J55DRAFT_510795 [Lentinula edodes]|uniref:F-box domain-containing protein n=1 Tax=Lentinula lateritia TaxID=40482 RepID=A0A9W9AIQ1_9AGAR|nr:hypothetical protein C8J55DRAFT_510795 [Lentinula edodes]